MKCLEVKAALRARFDDGALSRNGLEVHLAECAACDAYAHKLAALDAAFSGLPVEAPAPGFAARWRSHGVDWPVASAFPAWAVAPVAAVIVGTPAAVGWYFPIPFEPWQWAQKAIALRPEFSGAALLDLAEHGLAASAGWLTAARDGFAEAAGWFLATAGQWGLSGPWPWALILAAGLLLVAFNWQQAHSLALGKGAAKEKGLNHG